MRYTLNRSCFHKGTLRSACASKSDSCAEQHLATCSCKSTGDEAGVRFRHAVWTLCRMTSVCGQKMAVSLAASPQGTAALLQSWAQHTGSCQPTYRAVACMAKAHKLTVRRTRMYRCEFLTLPRSKIMLLNVFCLCRDIARSRTDKVKAEPPGLRLILNFFGQGSVFVTLQMH